MNRMSTVMKYGKEQLFINSKRMQRRNILISFKILLFFILPIFLTGQINIKNINLINPDSNLLYVGINNTILVNGFEKDSDLKMSVSEGIITKEEANKFIISRIRGQSDTIRIYNNEKIETFYNNH